MDNQHVSISGQSPPVLANYVLPLTADVQAIPMDIAVAPPVPLEILLRNWRRITGMVDAGVGNAFSVVILQHLTSIKIGGGIPTRTVAIPSAPDPVTAREIVVFDEIIYNKFAMIQVNRAAAVDFPANVYVRLMPIAN